MGPAGSSKKRELGFLALVKVQNTQGAKVDFEGGGGGACPGARLPKNKIAGETIRLLNRRE